MSIYPMVVALVLLWGGCSVAMAQSLATVHVSARIASRFHVRLLGPSDLQVSSVDVRRGYLDAPAPLVVAGNLRSRMPLAVTTSTGAVRRVQVFGPQGSLDVGPDGALFALDALARGGRTPLVFRFFLAPHTAPGVYPWPVTIDPAP